MSHFKYVVIEFM